MRVCFSQDGRAFTLRDRLGTPGAEGAVYAIAEDPTLCAKVYHVDKRDKTRQAKLSAMLESPPLDVEFRRTGHISLAWPTDILYARPDASRIVGFLMPRLQLNSMRPLHSCYALNDKRRFFGAQETTRHSLCVATNLASLVASVHEQGHACGDMNEMNVVVNNSGLVSMLDCDSFQIDDHHGTFFPSSAFPPLYNAPEFLNGRASKENSRREADQFLLGVHVFRLLMNGFGPFQCVGPAVPEGAGSIQEKIRLGLYPYSRRRTGILPPPGAPDFGLVPHRLQTLLHTCFVEGHMTPSSRPPALTWYKALLTETHRLKACSREPSHAFSGDLESCPHCPPETTIREPQTHKRQAPPPPRRGPVTPALQGEVDDVIELRVTPHELNFVDINPLIAHARQLSIVNAGKRDVSISIRCTESFILVDPRSFILSGGAQETVRVSIAAGTLPHSASGEARIELTAGTTTESMPVAFSTRVRRLQWLRERPLLTLTGASVLAVLGILTQGQRVDPIRTSVRPDESMRPSKTTRSPAPAPRTSEQAPAVARTSTNMDSDACIRGDGEACFRRGVALRSLVTSPNAATESMNYFRAACNLQFQSACHVLSRTETDVDEQGADPPIGSTLRPEIGPRMNKLVVPPTTSGNTSGPKVYQPRVGGHVSRPVAASDQKKTERARSEARPLPTKKRRMLSIREADKLFRQEGQ